MFERVIGSKTDGWMDGWTVVYTMDWQIDQWITGSFACI